MRISGVQRNILLILAACFVKGIRSIDSVSLRDAVEYKEKAKVDRANFRKSCLTLVDNGLIMRIDTGEEIQINITPEGYEKALELRETTK
ncbi:hypothetical protein [Vibrio phage CKB-S2]|nr:hypothetical protein [Vibrio phage CKB-S2]